LNRMSVSVVAPPATNFLNKIKKIGWEEPS
jgi:hypothetical protein